MLAEGDGGIGNGLSTLSYRQVNIKALCSAHPWPFGRNEQEVVGREAGLDSFAPRFVLSCTPE